MKLHKLCFLMVVFVAIAMFPGGQSVWADLTTAEFRDAFNSMNGGTGFHFINESLAPGNTNPTGLVVLKGEIGSQATPEYFSAYGGTTLRTFCIQPGIRIRENGILAQYGNDGFSGRLVYENDKTFTIDNEGMSYNLTVGAAFLYKAYITGDLAVAGYTDYTEIGNAIRFLTSLGFVSGLLNPSIVNWLDMQLSPGYNRSDVYDPAANYDFMDGYQVFVMRVWDDKLDVHSQDFLFIRLNESEPPAHMPEPATILLWTLGVAGAIGYARKRTRSNKQPA